jgi:hypothetical protein
MGGVEQRQNIRDLCKHLRAVPETPTLYVISQYVSPAEASVVRNVFREGAMRGGSSIYASSAPPLYEYREQSQQGLDSYFELAASCWERHIALLDGIMHPLLRMTDEMSAVLGRPVERLEINGRSAFFGQFRCFADDDIEPHVDMVEHEFPALLGRPDYQWAVNLNLESPDSGGELSLWDVVPSSDEYQGYGLQRPSVEPAIRFRPALGDLYFFPPRFVHAISRSSGSRCALAGFLAEWNDRGIRVWS